MSRGSSDKKGDAAHLRRVARVEREMREVIATYLLGGFRGELQGFVSVSRVLASRDLHHAKVLITVMGTPEEREATLRELAAHAYEIQGEVNRHLRMKFVPRLSFEYDEGMENSMRVEKILREIAEKRKADEAQTGGHSGPAPQPGEPTIIVGPDDDDDEDDQDEI